MNPSYFRIKLGKKDAIKRLTAWVGQAAKEQIDTELTQAVPVSLDNAGQWKGDCLYMYENNGWTVFEDLSGGFSFMNVESWQEFAQNDPLVVAGYNDAVVCAELVVIENGAVVKNFVYCDDMPEDNINQGTAFNEIAHWAAVASFVDEDDLVYSDSGTVLIF